MPLLEILAHLTRLPNGVRVQDVIVPAGAQLTPQFDAELLGGVAPIEADALARPSGEWSGTLYRPV